MYVHIYICFRSMIDTTIMTRSDGFSNASIVEMTDY